jgi:hypothetical protein
MMAEMLAKSMRYLAEMTHHVRDAQNTIERYRKSGSLASHRGEPVSQPQRWANQSGDPSQPLYAPPSSAEEFVRENAPAASRAMDEHNGAETGYGSAATTFAPSYEWPDPEDDLDDIEDDPRPRRGFWSHVPVVRRFIRRSK